MIPWEARFFAELADLLKRYKLSVHPGEDPGSINQDGALLEFLFPMRLILPYYEWSSLITTSFQELYDEALFIYNERILNPKVESSYGKNGDLRPLLDKEMAMWTEWLALANRYRVAMHPIVNLDCDDDSPSYEIRIALDRSKCNLITSFYLDSLFPAICLAEANVLIESYKILLPEPEGLLA